MKNKQHSGRNTWRAVAAALAIFGLAGVSGTLAAGVPAVMNYQGILMDASGVPYTNNFYNVEFRIWSGDTAGTLIWGERYNVYVIGGGKFNVILGQGGTRLANTLVAALPDAFQPQAGLSGDDGSVRWLGLTVLPATTEISPRQRILCAPYAFRAADAAALGGRPPESYQTNMPQLAQTLDRVGVGMAGSVPTEKFQVKGKVRAEQGLIVDAGGASLAGQVNVAGDMAVTGRLAVTSGVTLGGGVDGNVTVNYGNLRVRQGMVEVGPDGTVPGQMWCHRDGSQYTLELGFYTADGVTRHMNLATPKGQVNLSGTAIKLEDTSGAAVTVAGNEVTVSNAVLVTKELRALSPGVQTLRYIPGQASGWIDETTVTQDGFLIISECDCQMTIYHTDGNGGLRYYPLQGAYNAKAMTTTLPVAKGDKWKIYYWIGGASFNPGDHNYAPYIQVDFRPFSR